MQSQTFQLTASRRGWRVRHYTIQNMYSISTHSLTKRLTTQNRSQTEIQQNFNSQPHEEADFWAGGTSMSTAISTHSLTKRLTMKLSAITSYKLFQLTASRRGWPPLSCILWNSVLFQLTASRRGWLLTTFYVFFYSYFNSQPHEEADWSAHSGIPPIHYFNSQPHEEADDRMEDWTDTDDISTHSLTKRLTSFGDFVKVACINFNSQPHEEADGCLSFFCCKK